MIRLERVLFASSDHPNRNLTPSAELLKNLNRSLSAQTTLSAAKLTGEIVGNSVRVRASLKERKIQRSAGQASAVDIYILSSLNRQDAYDVFIVNNMNHYIPYSVHFKEDNSQSFKPLNEEQRFPNDQPPPCMTLGLGVTFDYIVDTLFKILDWKVRDSHMAIVQEELGAGPEDHIGMDELEKQIAFQHETGGNVLIEVMQRLQLTDGNRG